MSERQTPSLLVVKTDSTHHQSHSDPNSQFDNPFGEIIEQELSQKAIRSPEHEAFSQVHVVFPNSQGLPMSDNEQGENN